MAYIYKKVIGGKPYYYLRASIKEKGRFITKDLEYLGSDVNTVKSRIKELESKNVPEIRKAYKRIRKFIDSNYYLEKIRLLKLKDEFLLDKEMLINVEACKLHFKTVFSKLDTATKNETLKNFVIEFSFNTTSIEGNTITLKEAQNLLTDSILPKDKTLREVYDVRNTEKVFFSMLTEQQEISHELITNIHSELLKDIDERKGYRTSDVRVFKTNFEATPAPYVTTDMNLLLRWYNENKSRLHPLALAAVFHHKFEKIHPFMDGNGRTGRMLANYILIRAGYPPLIIRKKNRKEYLFALSNADKASLTKTDERHYIRLARFTAKEFYENYWNIFL